MASGPIQFSSVQFSSVTQLCLTLCDPMANRRGKSGSRDRFYFLGSKITVDHDCSQEIKRHLLLGRKPMTNLFSLLKSRDITSLTKVHTFKPIIFPVVRYGCETWIIKKAEHCRIDVSNCGAGEDSWESLGQQGDQSSQFPKEINPEYSLEGQMLKLKLQSFGHLMWTTDSLEKTLMLGKIDSRWRRRW